jgi:nucleoside-diphosphate-sugar epimerase
VPVPDDDLWQLNYEIPINIIRRYSNQKTLVINTSTYIQNYKGIKGQTVETYGATKELLSSALKSDADEGLYRVLDLYLFTLYGPGDRETHLVPLLLSAIKNKTVVSLSEGKQLLNLLYAQDAVDSIVGAITSSKKGYSAYHLWEPVYFTVRDLVLAIDQALETKLQVEWGAVPYSGHEMFEPWAIPIEKYPNLTSKISLADGIKLTFESMN